MLLPVMPRQCLFRFLVVCNVLFIAIGGFMLVYGVYQYSQATEIAEELEEAASDGTISILSGILDLLFGTVGLVGTLWKKRLFLYINLGLFSFSCLANVLLMAILPPAAFSNMSEASNSIKKDIVDHYGNMTSKWPATFTDKVNAEMRKEPCCGFSGKDGENIFLSSPWHRFANLHRTPADELTLPPACCIIMDDSCFTADNVKEARKNGSVFANDCLDLMLDEAKRNFWITMTQLIIVTILQFVMVALVALMVYQERTAT